MRASRPQHHRHEAPQVHQRAARDGARRSIKNCFTAPAYLPSAERGAADGRRKIRRLRKSWPSSPTASIARYACPPTTAAGLDDGIAAAMTSAASEISSPVGVIAGGGVMPFAVADSLVARGIAPVLFALKGVCDPVAVTRFRHHWISVGQFGRAIKLLRSENCRDLVFIGALVRPALSEIRLRLGNGPRARPRLGGVSRRRRSSVVQDRPHSSSRTVFGWSASRMSPPIC